MADLGLDLSLAFEDVESSLKMVFQIVQSEVEVIPSVIKWFGELLEAHQDHGVGIVKEFLKEMQSHFAHPNVVTLSGHVFSEIPQCSYAAKTVIKHLALDNNFAALVKILSITKTLFDDSADACLECFKNNVTRLSEGNAPELLPVVLELVTLAHSLLAKRHAGPGLSATYNPNAAPFVPRVETSAAAAEPIVGVPRNDSFSDFVDPDDEDFDRSVLESLRKSEAPAVPAVAVPAVSVPAASSGLRAIAAEFRPGMAAAEPEEEVDADIAALEDQTASLLAHDPAIQALISDLVSRGLESEVDSAIQNYLNQD